MNALNCIVVDDEKHAREGISDYVSRVPFLINKGLCKSVFEAQTLLKSQQIDLIFLDIQMPDVSGLDWVRSLSRCPLVIFTTAYREYALDGFEVNAVDYLVKPISFERFLKACNKALELTSLHQSSTKEAQDIFIKMDGQYQKVLLADIMYIEASGDYVFIHTLEKRLLALLTLKQIEEELPEATFLRVHRSFIINKQFVQAIEGNTLSVGEAKVPISRSLHDQVYKILMEGKIWKKRS